MTRLSIGEIRKIKTTTTFLSDSAYDYVAGRCLDINHFSFIAPPLLAISIEKALKAIIALKNSEFKPRTMKHGIRGLLGLVNEYDDYNISAYMDYGAKLEEIYKLRYPDNAGSPEGLTITTSDYNTIDEIYISLADQIKVPIEIKFRCGLHNIVFDQYDRFRMIKQWALKDNRALTSILPKWTMEYEEYLNLK